MSAKRKRTLGCILVVILTLPLSAGAASLLFPPAISDSDLAASIAKLDAISDGYGDSDDEIAKMAENKVARSKFSATMGWAYARKDAQKKQFRFVLILWPILSLLGGFAVFRVTRPRTSSPSEA